MNINVDKLFKLGLNPERIIIGLMSGTSLDGLDVALCKCTGSGTSTSVKILNFTTVNYSPEYRQEIQSIFSKREVDLQKVCLLNSWVAGQHATIVNACLQQWDIEPASVDVIASHGQTVYHAPKALHGIEKFGNATLQIGDGDHLAMKTKIITISDFRQKHIAAGGEGAPLAVYGDYLIFSKKGENRIMLNIGGIANFTFLPGDADATRVFSTDTGTGNTLMDAYIQQHFPGKYFDEDAAMASNGQVNAKLLAALKANDFFKQGFPKTTGPELFNLTYVEAAKAAAGVKQLSHEDMMATLNRFTADTIIDAIRQCTTGMQDINVYTSGGGMHNPLLMKNIQQRLPGLTFKTTGALNIHPDAKEAVLFAVLANEAIAGGKVKTGSTSKGIPFVSLGKISFPD